MPEGIGSRGEPTWREYVKYGGGGLSSGYRGNRELFARLNPDRVAMEPNRYVRSYGVTTDEVIQLKGTIAHFFGDRSGEKQPSSWPNWPVDHDYQYDSIPIFIEIGSTLFRETDRGRSLPLDCEDMAENERYSREMDRKSRSENTLSNTIPTNNAHTRIYEGNSGRDFNTPSHVPENTTRSERRQWMAVGESPGIVAT